DEVQKMLDAPVLRTRLGYRDRVMLEILYDTGIRRAELGNSKLIDIDLRNGYIHVKGKGGRERVVPVSHRVCGLIKNYILFVRPTFLHKNEQDKGYVFLSIRSQRMNDRTILDIVKRNAKRAGLKKNVTTHSFRHTCATHMLKNGAPVRHIQEMLGHESLESTQIYTR
ncbi:MAG: tyrosine-type recombinase/integrase, partial [FCB group bacterium]|nr:tyrosine-type recombinase/integrase [FCB group bacterium]